MLRFKRYTLSKAFKNGALKLSLKPLYLKPLYPKKPTAHHNESCSRYQLQSALITTLLGYFFY